MGDHKARHRRAGSAVGWLLVALLAVTACGSSDYHYVTNKAERTYFKVPAGWHQLDAELVRAHFANTQPASIEELIVIEGGKWVVAYDAAAEPALQHLTQPVDHPVVFAMIRPLAQAEQGVVSLDQLRDFFGPVTEAAVQAEKEAAAQRGEEFNIERHFDEVLTPNGEVHGIRTVYTVKQGRRELETRDITVLVSNDGTTLFSLVVRCSATCFQSRVQELVDISASFTVRREP